MILFNTLIGSTKPTIKVSERDKTQQLYYNEASRLATLPSQNYATIITTLSEQFSNSNIITLPPTISRLPPDAQINAIQQNVLEGKIDLLLNKINQITETLSEQAPYSSFCNYLLSFIGWLASVISAWLLTKFLDGLWRPQR
jgi:hypothetical protein